jgi:ABC-2 type transport system permease protein
MSVGSALWRKTLYHFRGVGRMLRAQSTFKIVFILTFALCMEAGLWSLFLEGFKFLDSLGGVGTIIINRVFSLFYMSTGILMVMSGAVTAHFTVFRSEEIPFLLTRPLQLSQLLRYKFMETAYLSSWAFFFIVVPFVGSYAQHARHSPLFALWTLLFSIPFLVLCASIGTAILMAIVRWFPRGRAARTAGFGLLFVFLLVGFSYSFRLRDAVNQVTFNLYSVVPGLRLASHPLFPGWWVAEGIMAFSGGQWLRGTLLWSTLSSTALVVVMATEALGTRIFFSAWQRVLCGHADKNRSPLLLGSCRHALRRFPHDVRAVLIKDTRTFLRDPVQWSQVLVFFGLLAVYFANLRSFNYHILPVTWRSMMIFLNVFSVAAVMCSLGARFIYPQLSLEGQGFWILGLSPTTMTRVLLTKFTAAALSLAIVSTVLILISSLMLKTDALTRWIALALVVAISIAVGGLSTGLGACFIDLRQRNPAAIVSGFGGTLNLVLGLVFMLAAILPFGILFHLKNLVRIRPAEFQGGIAVALGGLALLTAIAAIVPLWAGIRTLNSKDF